MRKERREEGRREEQREPWVANSKQEYGHEGLFSSAVQEGACDQAESGSNERAGVLAHYC
jgi:hypothetical protein